MNAVIPGTSRQETPVWFDAGDDLLFGILTTPRVQSRGVAVIVVSGAGTPLSTNVNGLSVRLCREVAGHGFHAFRFDYHGVGESTGVVDRFHLAEPFVVDLRGAIRSLRDRGIRRFVLVGSCFGARTVLAVAPGTEGLEGVILISPPVRDFEMGEQLATRLATELSTWGYVRRAVKPRTLAGLAHPERRRVYTRVAREKLRHAARSGAGGSEGSLGRYTISPRFLEPLRGLVERRIPISLIYGNDDLFAEFERARTEALGEVLEAGTCIELSVLPRRVHGFTSVDVQDDVLDLITDRLIRLPSR